MHVFRPLARGRVVAAALAALLAVSACGGDGGNAADAVAVDRGSTTLTLDAALDGVHWDADEKRLYLTDDDSNSARAWDGGTDFPVVVDWPAMEADQHATLGQITRGADGALYATRFGFGSYGGVVAQPRSGAARALQGLDPTRRRLGITPSDTGTLITGWFRGGAAGDASGVVSELTLLPGDQAEERDLITGMNKPTGLAVVGDTLFVSDQGSGVIRGYALADLRQRAQPADAAEGRVVATFAAADKLDLMAAGPDGTLYVGDAAGVLHAVAPDGAVRVLASGWPAIRGVAYDADNRRLFAAVMPEADGAPSSIRIVPLD